MGRGQRGRCGGRSLNAQGRPPNRTATEGLRLAQLVAGTLDQKKRLLANLARGGHLVGGRRGGNGLR
eukprot:5599207-Lingulodinium_polyedra.AAC.1